MRISSISINKEYVLSLLFMVVVFLLTRQVPFNNYSYLMNIALLLFFLFGIRTIILNIKRNYDLEFIFYVNSILLLILVLYSIYQSNEPDLIARFFLIIFLIGAAYYVKPKKIYVNIFLFLILLQALFVIGLEIYLLVNFDVDNVAGIRYFFRSNDWGDIYKFRDQLLWKVQPRGNALLPFAFFISLVYLSGRKRLILSAIYLIAILFAGNFAFILGLILFSILYILLSTRWTYQKIIAGIFILTVFSCIIAKPAFNYLESTIEIKSEQSNPTRVDQMQVLIGDLLYDVKSMLLGRGLGNTISEKTEYRDYTGDIYYELQSIYILNQVGLLYFILFVLINIFLAIYLMKHKLLLAVYFSYIFYAFFNPYLLDTSHVVVIIVLISLKEVIVARQSKSICNYCSL